MHRPPEGTIALIDNVLGPTQRHSLLALALDRKRDVVTLSRQIVVPPRETPLAAHLLVRRPHRDLLRLVSHEAVVGDYGWVVEGWDRSHDLRATRAGLDRRMDHHYVVSALESEQTHITWSYCRALCRVSRSSR